MGNVEFFFRNAPDVLILVKSAVGPLMASHMRCASALTVHMFSGSVSDVAVRDGLGGRQSAQGIRSW